MGATDSGRKFSLGGVGNPSFRWRLAHNFYVSKAPMDDPNGFASTMGTYLTGPLGSRYFAIGFISSIASSTSCPETP